MFCLQYIMSADNSIADPNDLESEDEVEDTNENITSFEDLDLPPLRMNATRVKERLCSSTSALQVPPNLMQQLTSRKRYSFEAKSSNRSRSRSPSLKDRATASTVDNSSLSSLEDIVDPDILYDKLGLVELDLKDQQQQSKQLQQHGNLPPVSERMCEDTLEDVHAFSDLSINSFTRPSSSVGGSTSGDVGSHALEPLDELDEVKEEDDDVNEAPAEVVEVSQVILTNMENLKVNEEPVIDATESTT